MLLFKSQRSSLDVLFIPHVMKNCKKYVLCECQLHNKPVIKGSGEQIKLEALRERRPPWLRQIITLILPTVKMLSLGCERLQFWIITCTTIWVYYHYYGVFLLIYSSYNTQITTKI